MCKTISTENASQFSEWIYLHGRHLYAYSMIFRIPGHGLPPNDFGAGKNLQCVFFWQASIAVCNNEYCEWIRKRVEKKRMNRKKFQRNNRKTPFKTNFLYFPSSSKKKKKKRNVAPNWFKMHRTKIVWLNLLSKVWLMNCRKYFTGLRAALCKSFLYLIYRRCEWRIL